MRSILSLALAGFIPQVATAEPTARFVAVLADVDMAGTAYEDGQLGAPLDAQDTLSIFDVAAPDAALATIAASNSVFSPPTVLDVSSDGMRAVVVETLQTRDANDVTLADLEEKPGGVLRLFDLSDPAAPALMNEVEVPLRPQAAQFNANADIVAVVGLVSANGLTLVPVGPDGLRDPATFDLGLIDRSDLPFDPAHNVLFHPIEDIVAIPLTLRNQIAFYRIERAEDGTPTGIEAWGAKISTNKFPLAGAFTPDGRHYVTSDLMWGPDVQRFYGARFGTLTSIRLADPADAEPRHLIQSIVAGGYQAESIAISPAGDRVAISSMRDTGLPQNDPAFDPMASVSLYALDGETGALSLIEEEMFEAHLPQGIDFDPSGTALFVGVNEYFDATDQVMRGGVELWAVSVDGVTRTETRMPAPRGVHVVEAIK